MSTYRKYRSPLLGHLDDPRIPATKEDALAKRVEALEAKLAAVDARVKNIETK